MGRERGRRATVAVVVVAALVAAAGCSEDRSGTAASTASTTEPTGADCTTDLLACARATSIADTVPDEPTEATGEPLLIGMINQENTPAGSFPELSSATQAGADFVNSQLGGVNGRPVEIEVCNTEFSPEGSTNCAQQMVQDERVAVLGGIDVFGTGIETLADNGIPFVGGIPISQQSVTSPNSYQWSGGSWGAAVAFAHHAATEAGAARVAILYGEFGPIADSARYAEETLESLGVEQVQLVPYPVVATDLTSPLEAAAAGDPDALIVLAADTGCQSAFDGVEAVGITGQVYYTGACAAPNIIEQAPPEKIEGAIFNVENLLEGESPDFDLYIAVAEEYGDGFDPVDASSVAFRSFMNLYAVLVGLDGDVTSEAIAAALADQVEAPSFMGHPSTCDGQQFAGLPALCSPQQVLGQLRDGQLTSLGGWIDVGAIYPGD
jgi:branched-chain amino acid transport system substrate-binding protein